VNDGHANVHPPSVNRSPLTSRIGEPADGTRVAAAIDALWNDIDRALRPIVGGRGVAALFERSLHLTLAAHPGLAQRDDLVDLTLDPAGLASLLNQKTPLEAAELGDAFLNTFRALLESLIGPSLTERLLRSAWNPAAADPSAGELP
jgi:hypothetical protein